MKPGFGFVGGGGSSTNLKIIWVPLMTLYGASLAPPAPPLILSISLRDNQGSGEMC